MRPPAQAAGRRQDELAMTPMIDVVFLLLVFFVWTSSFDPAESDLPAGMAAKVPSSDTASTVRPSQEQPPESLIDDLVLRINNSGGQVTYQLGDQSPGTLGNVQAALQTLAGLNQDTTVIVSPSGNTNIRAVVDGIDVARQAGFRRVMLAVDRS